MQPLLMKAAYQKGNMSFRLALSVYTIVLMKENGVKELGSARHETGYRMS